MVTTKNGVQTGKKAASALTQTGEPITKKAGGETTGKTAATAAGTVLRNALASKAEKAAAASTLTQRTGKKAATKRRK